jgi:hypothetical protein
MPADLEQILTAICAMHAAIFGLARQDFRITGFFGIAYARLSLSLLCLILYLVGRSVRKRPQRATPLLP